MSKSALPAIFLDRDGVLNFDKGYVHKLSDLEILSEVGRSLKFFKDSGFLLLVVTNQSGVARGYFSLEDVDLFHQNLNKKLFEADSVKIDDFFVCPHHSSGTIAEYSVICDCRKPKTKLADIAIKKWNVDLEASFMIGDKPSDIQLGKNLGIPSIQITNGQYEIDQDADFGCKNLWQAAEFIKNFRGT